MDHHCPTKPLFISLWCPAECSCLVYRLNPFKLSYVQCCLLDFQLHNLGLIYLFKFNLCMYGCYAAFMFQYQVCAMYLRRPERVSDPPGLALQFWAVIWVLGINKCRFSGEQLVLYPLSQLSSPTSTSWLPGLYDPDFGFLYLPDFPLNSLFHSAGPHRVLSVYRDFPFSIIFLPFSRNRVLLSYPAELELTILLPQTPRLLRLECVRLPGFPLVFFLQPCCLLACSFILGPSCATWDLAHALQHCPSACRALLYVGVPL